MPSPERSSRGLDSIKPRLPARSLQQTPRTGGTVYPSYDGARLVSGPSRPRRPAGERGPRRPRLSGNMEQRRGGLLLQRDVLPDAARHPRAGGSFGGRVVSDSGKFCVCV